MSTFVSRTVPAYAVTNPMDTTVNTMPISSIVRAAGTYANRALSKKVPMAGMGALNKELKVAFANSKRSYGTNRGRDMGGYTNTFRSARMRTRAGRRRGAPKKKTMSVPKVKKAVPRLLKQVRNLSKEMKSARSELIYHQRITDSVLSSVNSFNHTDYVVNNLATLELVLGQLRFFNPASPGTLTTADGSTGTYGRDYHFKSIYSKVDVYNNYQVPAIVTIYAVVPKGDTSILPTVSYSNGLADVGNPTSTSPMLHLTDSPQFNELWKILITKTKRLMPGQSMSVAQSVKDVYYNPSVTDSQTATYQPRYKCWAYIVRTQGVYGHDSVAAQQAQLASGVDVCLHNKFVVSYDAGADLKYIYINDAAPSFFNGGLVSSKPVSDNIGYSLA